MRLTLSMEGGPLKRVMFFAVGWLLAISLSANGLYAISSPSNWLRAKWTTTRGFGTADPSSSRIDRFKIRFLGVVLLITGVLATAIISVVSFIAMRDWYEGHH